MSTQHTHHLVSVLDMYSDKFDPRMNEVCVMMKAREEVIWSREDGKLDLHSRKRGMIS